MKKHFLSLILSITLAVAALPLSSYATSVSDDPTATETTETVDAEGEAGDTQEYSEDDETLDEIRELFEDDDEDEDIGDDDELYDWEEVSQSMSQDEAQLRLDFAKTRREYTVVVSVGSTGADEECGSDEDFYFQLVFEKGTSGVVLANTQLQGDRFRTGADEIFYIRTNRDYGDLQSIRIIPKASGDGVFDKLKIDRITVAEADNSGICERWVIEDVGWIGKEYSDKDVKKDRSDISALYAVSGFGTSVNLQVCVATAEVVQKDPLVQFEGMVKGQINYISTDGYYRTRLFDVAEAIKAYNTEDNGFETLSRANAYETESLLQSDPNRMFRANHMDRFVITLEDMMSVMDINFTCTSNAETVWGIESVSLSLVKEPGLRVQNANDEFIRDSVTEPFAVNKETKHSPAYKVKCTKTGTASVSIPFTSNMITINEETREKTVDTEIKVASDKDELNLFIFPDEKGDNGTAGEYDLASALQYIDVYGTAHQVTPSTDRMQKIVPEGDSGSIYYSVGMSGENIGAISRLLMTCYDDFSKPAVIDHAIVQRTRGSTVVGTYYYDVNSDVRDVIANILPTGLYGKDIEITNQTLVMQFSDKTDKKKLSSGTNDIYFAIDYKSDFVPGDRVVRSSYISLTEMGIKKIRPGMVVSIPFEELYAGEIVSVTAFKQGTFDADISAAYLTNLDTDRDRFSMGYYSFGDGIKIGRAMDTTEVTASSMYDEGSVLPLRITFETADAASNIETGNIGGVSAEIGYIDNSGAECIIELSDIRDYITGDKTSLSAGSAREVLILVPDAADLSYITLATDIYSWSLAKVSADLGDGLVERSRAVRDRVTDEGITIPLDETEIEEPVEEEETGEEGEEGNESGESEGSEDSGTSGESESSGESTTTEE